MGKVFITRIDALKLINQILDEVDSLTDEQREGLQDIAHCIDVEREYYHEWGGDGSEVVYLHLPPESKIVQSLDTEELKRIYKKYRFRPSVSDLEESESQIEAMKKTLYDMGLLGTSDK